MALGIGYGLPFLPHFGSGADPYKPLWNEALEGAKAAGATVEDEGGTCLVARGSEAYNAGLPATPSLLIVPQFYKAGNLYQDVPPFVAEDSTMRFAVTRATTARRVNQAGLIESVASGVPRIDWLGQSCPALLVEPRAQNRVLHSRDLTNAVWSGSNVTAAKNAVGADGVASGATTLTATAASGTVLQALSHASQSRVFSAYVRRVTGTGAIQMTTNGGTNWTTVTISSLYTQVACAAQTVASGTIGFRMAVSGDVIEVDFTQGEVGPAFTSPIPTTTGSLTRNADVISVSGAVSGAIGQTEGTIYAEVDVRNRLNGTAVLTLAKDAGVSSRVIIYTNTSNRWRANYTDASGTIVDTSAANDTQVLGVNKLAFAYGAGGDATVHCNGSLIITLSGTSTFVQELRAIFLGSSNGEALFFNNRIRAAALYTTRLDNATLEQLTKL